MRNGRPTICSERLIVIHATKRQTFLLRSWIPIRHHFDNIIVSLRDLYRQASFYVPGYVTVKYPTSYNISIVSPAITQTAALAIKERDSGYLPDTRVVVVPPDDYMTIGWNRNCISAHRVVKIPCCGIRTIARIIKSISPTINDHIMSV
jgi:hypothetical protein